MRIDREDAIQLLKELRNQSVDDKNLTRDPVEKMVAKDRIAALSMAIDEMRRKEDNYGKR